VAQVTLSEVTKRFDDVVAVESLNLEIEDGELLVLLGPSGCGKSTVLRMVAGLEDVTEGTISIGGQVVNDLQPRDRDVAMVFQSYALYPHLSVAKNIEFPLRHHGVPRQERERLVQQTAAMLSLTDLLHRRPGALSGGQRQRVALARAIVRSPKAFLMDEPLSNLDATLRTQTRADIVTLQRRLGTTTIYVTHDQVEAMTMGDRIAVLNAGRLQQVAPPQELYERPANTFVAGFLGSPGMNLMPATVEAAGGQLVGRMASGLLPLPRTTTVAAGAEVVIGCRPEDLAIDPEGTFTATVAIVELLGADVHVVCQLDGGPRIVVRQEVGAARPAAGAAIRLRIDPAALHLFDAASGSRLSRDGIEEPSHSPA
jgi:multiple sugar transport system ATP-binding protein